ncbi:MAG: hypothetical protein H5U05_10720 [Candidatus Aminicenantes bacterium]|nr:hypothetical protein [Candidatus Aminicenantes bacterium]
MATTPSLFGSFVVARDKANDPWETLYEKVSTASQEATQKANRFATANDPRSTLYKEALPTASQKATQKANYFVLARATANDPWSTLYKEVLLTTPQKANHFVLARATANDLWRTLYKEEVLLTTPQKAKDLWNFYKIKDDWQKMRAFEAKLNEVKKENPNYKLPDEYQKMYEEQKDKLVQKRLSQNSVSPYEPQGEQVIIDKDASYSRARAGAASNRKKRATTILTGGSDSSLGLGSKSVGKVTLLGI